MLTISNYKNNKIKVKSEKMCKFAKFFIRYPVTMKISQIIDYLNSKLLPVYQESYDNSGFLVGDPDAELTGVLIALDVTPDVVAEAVEGGFNLIVSHHPLVFGGIKRITTATETGRMLITLLRANISVYAAHTNLDNLDWGVNGVLAAKLGLEGCRVLRPVEGALRKLVTYVPAARADEVRQALFAAGAGCIGGYDQCSYNSDGYGTFRANEGCSPYCGEIGELHREPETRIEVIYEKRLERKIVQKLVSVHPYEEPAYDCVPLANPLASVGAGMIGRLARPVSVADFLEQVKTALGLPLIRSSMIEDPDAVVEKVAICGGAGSFLIGDAKAAGADIYLTGDLKYHDFQQAENSIILADIGHYESEQFSKELIYRLISEKFSTFACRISEKNAGFVQYI